MKLLKVDLRAESVTHASASPGEASPRERIQQMVPQRGSDRWKTVPVSAILSAESKNLALRLPFSSDGKCFGEERLQYTTGSNPQPGRVMFTEIETDGTFVGELYRQNGEMVFEPAEFAKGQRLLFSRESFHEVFQQAVKDLKKYPDVAVENTGR